MREQENAEVDLREANPKECGRDASSRRFARLRGGKAQRRGISEAMRGRKTVKEKLSSLLTFRVFGLAAMRPVPKGEGWKSSPTPPVSIYLPYMSLCTLNE